MLTRRKSGLTVRELITRLEKYPPAAEVELTTVHGFATEVEVPLQYTVVLSVNEQQVVALRKRYVLRAVNPKGAAK